MALKIHRMRRSDFLSLKNSSRRLSDELFSIVVAPSSIIKVAVSVSSKQVKGAAERNSIKRRVREALKRELLPIKKGFFIVVYPSKSVSKRSFKELTLSLKGLISRIS